MPTKLYRWASERCQGNPIDTATCIIRLDVRLDVRLRISPQKGLAMGALQRDEVGFAACNAIHKQMGMDWREQAQFASGGKASTWDLKLYDTLHAVKSNGETH